MQNGPLKMAAGLIRFNGDAVEGGVEGGVGGWGGKNPILFARCCVSSVPVRRTGARGRVEGSGRQVARPTGAPDAFPLDPRSITSFKCPVEEEVDLDF